MNRFNISDSGQMIHIAFNDIPNAPKSTVSSQCRDDPTTNQKIVLFCKLLKLITFTATPLLQDPLAGRAAAATNEDL